MFYVIERKPETNKEIYSRLARKLHEDFTNQYHVSINESDFQCFMQKAFEAVKVGNKLDWGILAGLSFTMTSLTTIGKRCSVITSFYLGKRMSWFAYISMFSYFCVLI